jgi:hypothetical protein
LPAGHYRVEVEWIGQRHGETIGLQLGTTGEPWRTWPVDPRPGERWTTEFSVPLDVGFVGLRGTPELERTIGRIAIVPLAVVNATDRPRLPPVVAASSAHNASFFYYNGNGFPESRGFWVRGGRRTQVTVERPAFNGETLLVRVHSGLIDNRLEIALPGWRESIDLKREQPRDIEIPSSARRLVTMEVAAEATFVPFEIEAGSLDKRPLGVWIEVVR